ncbi:DUF4302 domain-containing protein [Chitinophaga sp. sic0106]|uniref:DUF4302 domain-containing protein n=1 Tax=Chitinophaga sp. sic0106 TaxID=2854785 RepID=UPI001C473A87|nr:DUF4302 domain-containing protein [Chitinophaga sp. sic0106]MBV7528593.1 DUF4302 domain-containing protein [Chitinophaga sp. sic0106]
MIKKLALYTILSALAFSACKKSDDPFMEDPDKRLIARLAENEQLLTSAEFGWKATIYPIGGKGFSYYFKFGKDNSVEMMGDFDATTATTPKSSTYRLKALQWPTLIFDTYNYIHLPNDPAPGVSGGTAGAGLQSDFQFVMDKMVGDTFFLVGIDRSNLMTMVRLTSAEQKEILAGKVAESMSNVNAYAAAVRFPTITFKDGKLMDLSIAPATRRVRIGYMLDETNVFSKTRAFAYTSKGIILDEAVSYNGFDIRELIWDAEKKNYYVKSGETTYYLGAGATPAVPLAAVFGGGKDYTAIDYTPATLKGTIGTDFDAAFTASSNLFKGASGTLNTVKVILNSDNTYTLRVNYVTSAAFVANLTFTIVKNPDGSFKLVFNSQDGNATTRASLILPLKTYFESSSFKIRWVTNTIPGSVLTLGGLAKANDDTQFFYGVVGN